MAVKSIFVGLILILREESKILAYALSLFLQMTGSFFEKIFSIVVCSRKN